MSKKSHKEKEVKQNEIPASAPAESAPAVDLNGAGAGYVVSDDITGTEYVVADDFVGTDTCFTVNTTDESIYTYNQDAIYEG